MSSNTLHMKVGSNLGNVLLDIAQTNISKGDIKKGIDTYVNGLCGFTKEYALMCLKNQAVLVTDKDGEGVTLKDDEKLIVENAHNILDWELIITNRMTDMYNIMQSLHRTANDFMALYRGNIEDYSILEMMERYFSKDELATIGKHNLAACIIGSSDCKLHEKYSNSAWGKIEYAMESEDNDLSKWEKILYYTVHYNRLIRMLHKDYMNFENMYLFLVENGFINKPERIEHMIEMVMQILWKFSDTSTGYCHPRCNTGLYEYKKKLADDLIKTRFGNEFAKNGIRQKDIMDGYDAGWLSPDGEFYGDNGDTSAMIHMNLAEQIFNAPCNKYAVRMSGWLRMASLSWEALILLNTGLRSMAG